MRLGVFGGTFDPLHLAHLVAAETAHAQAALDRVSFLPAGDPWQKSTGAVTDAQLRVAMVRSAIKGIPYFQLDEREVHRQGPSRSVDTVRELRSEGHQPVLIVGADSAQNLTTWFEWEALLELCELAVVPRPGVEKASLHRSVLAKATWLSMPTMDISSTDIRSRISAGMPYRFLVPEGVREIVQAEGLYG